MDLEKEINLENNQAELVTEQEQNSFLESSIGKAVDSALDVGLRMILPDFLEEGVLEVKDALFQGGFKEGVQTAIDSAINLGKSIIGVFTGKFDDMSQARDAVKSGGIIDGISSVLDKVINKTSSSGLINSTLASIISNGKDAILNSVSSKIENEFVEQIDGVSELSTYENNWKEYFENENFNGMEEEFNKIQDKLEELMPLEKLIRDVRTIENLHMLIKNNGQNFDLTAEQRELADMLN